MEALDFLMLRNFSCVGSSLRGERGRWGGDDGLLRRIGQNGADGEMLDGADGAGMLDGAATSASDCPCAFEMTRN